MPDDYLPDNEVTLEMLQEGDENIKVRRMFDFLRKGFKTGNVFPQGERSITASRDGDGNMVFEFEDTTVNNTDRDKLTVTNGDLIYAGGRIYAGSRRFINDFWDVADETRLPVHYSSEARLLDFTRVLKQYAIPEVWHDLVERVVGAAIVDEPHARKIMLSVHRSKVINDLLFERGVHQFVELLNRRVPDKMEAIVGYYIVLRITSRKFCYFFEQERELTLGETVSRTED